MARQESAANPPQVIESEGPWPFVTRRHYIHGGQHQVWQSRDHRRGLRHGFRPGAGPVWSPETLNPWIGWGFAAGAFLFVSGAVLSLLPALAKGLGLSATEVNAVFFIGSVFFTLAAYLQVIQAANSGTGPDLRPVPQHRVVIGWQPHQIGWLSSFLQFLGTVMFNVSTFLAVRPPGGWIGQDLEIWAPDAIGSVLFLLSGYLAFIETCHRYWAWHPRDISWWVVLVNLLGCVAFMISALLACVGPDGPQAAVVAASVRWALAGAIGFLAGAALMLIEGRSQGSPR